MNLGLYSYLGATIAYSFFAVLLLFSWRGSLQSKLFTIAVIISAIWTGLAAKIATDSAHQIGFYQTFEILRYIAWYIFLLKLFDPVVAKNIGYQKFVRWALPLSICFACLVLVNEYFSASGLLAMVGHVFLAIIGLAIIEQLYRNTAVRHRWSIKYLFIGAGGIFAFDFYMYVDAILFYSIDKDLWAARGIVNMVAVPMLAISAARNKNWSLKIFVSRDIVLTTTTIIAGALYLLVMAGAGHYLQEYGGDWGQIIQVVFFSLAVTLLAVVLSSAQLRASSRVFFGKHFYENKYDYRREWLLLTDELNNKGQGKERFDAVIQVLARIVDARAGMLWLYDDRKQFRNAAAWQTNWIDTVVPCDMALVQFLEETGYVTNLMDMKSHVDEYQGLVLPHWMASIDRPWLIVPLFGPESMLGFVILAKPLSIRSINWEDRDLLKTAAKQVASYLAVLTTSEALAEAKQFEVFNRLSAYMVHDLKNISAELVLVARNAEKHKDNAEFLEDAFATVDSAANGINKLLDQLREKHIQNERTSVFELGSLVQKIIETKQGQSPKPRLEPLSQAYYVAAEKSRLANVLAHLIENAQQATGEEGSVTVTLENKASIHTLEIRDTGHGMDADFIQNRLFKPFDTTKGNAGMGIGMYESRELIRHIGGEIYVQSEPGKGSTISLHIPVSLEHSTLASVNV
jgi:putative PEP-CTERM system histidine kinase